MLTDIVEITDKIFNQAFKGDKKLETSPQNIYNIYTALKKVISHTSLVAKHYLALDFTEGFLQNSSWGEPVDKWRWGLNKDLELLNSSAKNYLLCIVYIRLEDNEWCGLMSSYYDAKSYYGFVRDMYSVGYIEPCGCTMISHTLDTDVSAGSQYFQKHKKLDLSCFESRQELKEHLLKQHDALQVQLHLLKAYISKKFTIEDLL